jgi:Trk-type K+ transport system membrane component
MNRSRWLIVIGAALLAIGLTFVTYNRVVLERTEKKSVGPFSMDVPRRQTFTMPKLLAWTMAASGAAALVIGIRERKSS